MQDLVRNEMMIILGKSTAIEVTRFAEITKHIGVPNLYSKFTTFPLKQTLQSVTERKIKQTINLDKSHISKMTMIGQISGKFMVCYLPQANFLVMLDPHAADERIILEKLTKSYQTPCQFIDHGIIQISSCYNDILKDYQGNLSKYGLALVKTGQVRRNGDMDIKVSTRFGPEISIDSKTAFLLAVKCIHWVHMQDRDHKRFVMTSIPAPIQDLLNSKACRYKNI